MCSWENDKCTFDKTRIISELKDRCPYVDSDTEQKKTNDFIFSVSTGPDPVKRNYSKTNLDNLSPADLEDVWNDSIYTSKKTHCYDSYNADMRTAWFPTKKYKPKIDYVKYLKGETKQRRNNYRCYPKIY